MGFLRVAECFVSLVVVVLFCLHVDGWSCACILQFAVMSSAPGGLLCCFLHFELLSSHEMSYDFGFLSSRSFICGEFHLKNMETCHLTES